MRVKPSHLPRIRRDVLDVLGQLSSSELQAEVGGPRQEYPWQLERLPMADLLWVSQDMTRQAVDGALDVPPTAMAAVWPSQHGIAAFDGGLPGLQLASGQTARPSVLTWCRTPVGVVLMLWAPPGDITGQTPDHLVAAPLLPVSQDTGDPARAYEADEMRPESARVVSLVLAVWTMMSTPTMASVTERMEAGPKVDGGRRRDVDRAVKLVELRRLAHKPTEHADREERFYRHRWVVRGHWRQQACGPDRSERQTIWIPPHIKGPEGAPLLAAETVFAWRR